MEPAGSGATWTGSPKGVFAERKHHKPRQGVVTNTLKLYANGAVGFIVWLDRRGFHSCCVCRTRRDLLFETSNAIKQCCIWA